MDFSYSEEQQAVADLAAQILADHASHEALRTLETSGSDRFDPALWQAFAEAGLIGEVVMRGLKDLDKVAYVRFASVYRRFEDVQDFMAEVKDLTGEAEVRRGGE